MTSLPGAIVVFTTFIAFVPSIFLPIAFLIKLLLKLQRFCVEL
jgi:hypothetical protein